MTNFEMKEPFQLTEHFLKICPEFQSNWDKHIEYWGDKDRGEYNDIAEFARFIVDSYANHKTERFSRIFNEIEQLLIGNDAKVRELVTIGLLEDIQTIASHQDFGSEVFVQWLGPVSRKAWDEIAKAWEGKQSLMDVLRDEQKQRDNNKST